MFTVDTMEDAREIANTLEAGVVYEYEATDDTGETYTQYVALKESDVAELLAKHPDAEEC